MTPPAPPARADPPLEWVNMAMPEWHLSSDDGAIDCIVEFDIRDGGWSWSANKWLVSDSRRLRLVAHDGGPCSNDDEGKAKVAEWLKANL